MCRPYMHRSPWSLHLYQCGSPPNKLTRGLVFVWPPGRARSFSDTLTGSGPSMGSCLLPGGGGVFLPLTNGVRSSRVIYSWAGLARRAAGLLHTAE